MASRCLAQVRANDANFAFSEEELRRQNKSLQGIFCLAIVTTLIILFGLILLYSVTADNSGKEYLLLQLRSLVVAIFAGGICFIMGAKVLKNFAEIGVILSVILLLLVFIFDPVKGAYRWVKLPGFQFQPSELAKLALCVYLAKSCSKNMHIINTLHFKKFNIWDFNKWSPLKQFLTFIFFPIVFIYILFGNFYRWLVPKGVFSVILGSGIIILMVVAGRDLGTTLLMGAVTVITLLAAGNKFRYTGIYSLLGLGLGSVYVFLNPERLARIKTFMNPEKSQLDEGFQLWRSFLALGSGGLYGLGFTESRMKQRYLPEHHTDFILSIGGEELGFIGIACVVIGYLIFAYFGLKISLNARSRYNMLLGFSITMMISMQALINLLVISGGVPTKGMPAPFISYGGTNLIFCVTGVFILVAIGIDTIEVDYHKTMHKNVKKYFYKVARFIKG
ncbi:FtsW/RodA/SpoVE family cell cycle protein [Lentisphaerota bacterium WC36G]|nr:FtsW/RodA/SpoVE family cell cycle protein [Lentisphaerae bacterium WC36]